MERYDYHEAVKEDVKQYIKDNYTAEEIAEKLADSDGWSESLNDDLFVSDSVTGNASGSYYCNAWKAEEAICHNLELLGEAMKEFCCDADYLERGAEACDVTIRCYLLSGAIAEALEELAEEYPPIDPEALTPEEAVKKFTTFKNFCDCRSCHDCPFDKLSEDISYCEELFNTYKKVTK